MELLEGAGFRRRRLGSVEYFWDSEILEGDGFFKKKEFLCSLRPLGVFSGSFPSCESPDKSGSICFGFCSSLSIKTASRSSSELLACSFSLGFLRLRLAAAKMEETSSRLYWSFPDPHEP